MSFLKTATPLAGFTLTALMLTACSTSEIIPTASDPETAKITEESSPQSRLVSTFDGGLLTLDASTLEVLDKTELDGFNRVNSAGDGRHVFASTSEGFQLLDTGAWTEPHGDHTHSYSSTPGLTDTTFVTEKPGHVVSHADTTVLFGDGDGKIQILDTSSLLKGDEVEPEIKNALEAHHGVAVQLENGNLLHTLGTSESRNGAVVFDTAGNEIARSEECPGVHGESAASGEAIAVGCEDGVLIYKEGKFTKVQSPDSYGRIGNQAGSDISPIVLGDYKVDKDAELERPTRVSLTNTATGALKLVDLGTSYTFRSLGRGPAGEALVLGTDGQLHVIDQNSGEVSNSYPVIDPWLEPDEWQSPRPTLQVLDDLAYITDPAKNTINIVDINTGEIVKSAELPHTPNEISVVSG